MPLPVFDMYENRIFTFRIRFFFFFVAISFIVCPTFLFKSLTIVDTSRLEVITYLLQNPVIPYTFEVSSLLLKISTLLCDSSRFFLKIVYLKIYYEYCREFVSCLQWICEILFINKRLNECDISRILTIKFLCCA